MEGVPNTDRVWVVVPAFNEAQVISEVITDLRSIFKNIVVVDDGSDDGTAEKAHSVGASVLKHIINLGQGAALQTGISYALKQGAEFVATFDADGQHEPSDLLAMLETLNSTGADIAIGSRFLGSAPGMTTLKRILLRAAMAYQRISSKTRLTDVHNGLRLVTRSAASRLKIHQNRMAHASEIITQIDELGLRMVEVPCVIKYTDYSKRKGQGLFSAINIIFDIAVRGVYR